MSVETRNSIPSLAQIIDAATIFGIVLALGILGHERRPGPQRGGPRPADAHRRRRLARHPAHDHRRDRGALGFTGAVIGIVGGYLAAIGFFRSNQLDGLSSLSSIPLTNLLVILVGMPLAAAVIGWLPPAVSPPASPASRSTKAGRISLGLAAASRRSQGETP